MPLSPAERETVIQTDDESKVLKIWSCQSKMINKLARANILPTRTLEDGTCIYENVDFNRLSFRKESSRKGKPMSEEHKQKLAEARKRKGKGE